MSRLRAGLVAALAVAALGMVACGGADQPDSPEGAVRGIVVDLDGSLTEVRSFTVLAEDGTEWRFVPAPGIDFDGAPLSHLRDHIRTAEPVVVTYETADGTLVATAVTDAGAG